MQWRSRGLVALVLGGAACNQALHTGDYHEVPDSAPSAGAAGAGAAGVAGQSGTAGVAGTGGCVGAANCFSCTPTKETELANACTSAMCQAFDSSRLTLLGSDGSRPSLPAPEGSAGMSSGGAAGASSGGAAGAPTFPSCSSFPNVVYVTGSTAAQSFLSTVAQLLAGQTGGDQTTIVYQGQGSCVGVDAILNGTPISGQATYWQSLVDDPTGAAHTCSLDTGSTADVGASDVFATTCFDLAGGLPSNVNDVFGPVQVMTFVVPSASSQSTIDFDAAYFVFGFGSGSGVSPWTDESQIFQRSSSSGTQNMIAAFTGVPPDVWRGKQHASTSAMTSDLLSAGASAATAEKTIGILGADSADTLRGQIRVLSLQGKDQSCGYWPDSTPTATDKRNVRDGHYEIWGPLHLLTRVGGNGAPVNPSAGKLLGYLVGTSPLPGGLDLIQLYASRGLIPLCAMRVSRKNDGGELSPSVPDAPCGCHYDYVATGATDCTPCTSASMCPTDHPACSFGYCEATQ